MESVWDLTAMWLGLFVGHWQRDQDLSQVLELAFSSSFPMIGCLAQALYGGGDGWGGPGLASIWHTRLC